MNINRIISIVEKFLEGFLVFCFINLSILEP